MNKESSGTEFTNPNLSRLAESFGIDVYQPGDLDDLGEVYNRTINSSDLPLIGIHL